MVSDSIYICEIIWFISKIRFLNLEDNLNLLEFYYLGDLYYKISTILSYWCETSFILLLSSDYHRIHVGHVVGLVVNFLLFSLNLSHTFVF